MNDKKRKLIEVLQQANGWVSALHLASILNVSTRSLRRYISDLNQSELVIISSNQGYQLINSPQITESNETPKERKNALFSDLLFQPEGLDIYDASARYYVSESTILSDIAALRKEYEPYGVNIIQKKDQLMLVAEESNKRKLMKSLFYEESTDSFFDIDFISKMFTVDNAKEIRTIINRHIAEAQLYVNEYTINSLIVHLSISLHRIKQHNYISMDNDVAVEERIEQTTATKIVRDVEKLLNLSIPSQEINYLAFILMTKTTLIDYRKLTEDNIGQYLEPTYFNLTLRIIDSVQNTYHIDLKNDDFIIKFSVHLKNLIDRVRAKTVLQNPLTPEIKATYPFIYNLSVFIAYEIQKEIGLPIDEHEITYISFHVGSFFEREKYMQTRIDCTVICPEYYSMHSDLVNRLNLELGQHLEIVRTITSLDVNLDLIDSTLILSTIPLTINNDYIKISPFLKQEDIKLIHNRVNEINNRMQHHLLVQYLDDYFSEKMFVIAKTSQTKEEAISELGHRLIANDIMDKTYLDNIFKREQMSSTAFTPLVAMPHAMEQTAKRSSLGILINRNGIKWDSEHTVKIIIMVIMSEKDRYSFYPIFDGMIAYLSDFAHASRLIEATSFHEFKQLLAKKQ